MSRISKTDHLGRTTTSKVIRNPKCARCRNHGLVVQLRGHAGKCPFSHCECWKCSLITERTKIMAIQRRMGKKRKDESLSSVSRRFRETPPQASCGVEIIDVINDPADVPVNDSGPRDSSTPGFRASVIQRTESVIKAPPARRFEADGKTYAELVPVRSLTAEKSIYYGSPEEMAARLPVHGSGYGGAESEREGMLYGVPPPWSAALDHRAMPHFSGDYILTAVAQRDVYSSELMTLPFPMKFYGHYPSSYGRPAILFNAPPTPAAPGPCNEPQMSFAGFVPSSVPCLPESRPAQDCQTAFFNPPLMSACSLRPQEDLTFQHPPYPTLHVHGGQGGGDHRLGS